MSSRNSDKDNAGSTNEKEDKSNHNTYHQTALDGVVKEAIYINYKEDEQMVTTKGIIRSE